MREDTIFNDFRDLFLKIKKGYLAEINTSDKSTFLRLSVLTVYYFFVLTLAMIVIPVTHLILAIFKN